MFTSRADHVTPTLQRVLNALKQGPIPCKEPPEELGMSVGAVAVHVFNLRQLGYRIETGRLSKVHRKGPKRGVYLLIESHPS